MNKQNKIILGVAVLALIVGIIFPIPQQTSNQFVNEPSLASQIIDRGTIKVGYVVYPPSLIKDPNTGKLSGISYDLIEEIAKKLNLKTEWVEEVAWGSMIEGLKTGRYDVIGTLIWPNSARAREATFSVPAMYSVVLPYARVGETRFNENLSNANTASVTIATIDGEMTSFIAKDDFPNAKTIALPQTSSVAEVLTNIITKKADLTFVEPAIAKDFIASNPNSIKQISAKPIRVFENVFAVKRGANELTAMLNVSLKELLNDGTVKRIVGRYDALDSFRPVVSSVGERW